MHMQGLDYCQGIMSVVCSAKGSPAAAYDHSIVEEAGCRKAVEDGAYGYFEWASSVRCRVLDGS